METSSLNQLNELKEIQVQNSWYFLFLSFFQESLNGAGANLATDTLKRKQNEKQITSAELVS